MSKESPRNINQLDMPLLQDNITDLEMGLKEATGVSVAKTARSYGMETCDFMKYLLIMAQEVSTHALKIGANVTKSTLVAGITGARVGTAAAAARTTASILVRNAANHFYPGQTKIEGEDARLDNALSAFYITTAAITLLLMLKDAKVAVSGNTSDSPGTREWQKTRAADDSVIGRLTGDCRYVIDRSKRQPTWVGTFAKMPTSLYKVGVANTCDVAAYFSSVATKIGKDNIIGAAAALGAFASSTSNSYPMLGAATNAIVAQSFFTVVDTLNSHGKDIATQVRSGLENQRSQGESKSPNSSRSNSPRHM